MRRTVFFSGAKSRLTVSLLSSLLSQCINLSAQIGDDSTNNALHECTPQDPAAEAGFVAQLSPDFFETNPDGSRPVQQTTKGTLMAGAIAPAAGQIGGALTGKIVFTSGGHGWTYANGDESITRWYTQRGVTQEMNEDYGNMDQMTMFAYYCFNAGATVVPIRPVGHQTNQVVLDNVNASWSGSWTDSSSTLYFGAAGAVPYRYTALAATETATATYTPNIPVAGFYPVYGWTRHGSDRTSQLYRIRHTGGESQVRIPHDKVGNGWVYLGTYYFNAGSSATTGSVIISNLRPTPNYGTVVIADAIRFGNGMGDVVPTPKASEATTISRYPREEEASRYWVQRATGQGQSTSTYNSSSDDNGDNVGTPPRTAAEMNRQEGSTYVDRVYVGFHSNAGGGRGCVGLYNNATLFPGTSTTNQQQLASFVASEVDADMRVLPLEVPWQGRNLTYARSDYAFGEIRGDSIKNEMAATILEVAFHDEVSDGKLLRDPKMRNWTARATLQGILRYFDQYDTNFVLTYLPEPPYNVSAIAAASGITISWNTPLPSRRSGAPTNYVVYRSTNGFGFGNPVFVGSTGTTLTLTNLPTDTDLYFRVSAVNAGGESLPSETVGCRRASVSEGSRVLFINAYSRLDRGMNLRHTPSVTAWKPPGNSGTMERVLPRSNNSFDYVVQHGQAINANGNAFDSCSKMSVTNGSIQLTNYSVVVWAAGEEMTGTIDSNARTRLSTYLQSGRGLFVSGSEIATEMGRSVSSSANRSFLQNQLHATLASDANTNSLSYTVTALAGGIFNGNSSATIDDGTKGIYWVKTPEVLTPASSGAQAILNYSNGSGAAAIQYDGSAGGGRVVYFGFPFETITLAARRTAYMADILTFLTAPPPTGSPSITSSPATQTVNRYSDVAFYVSASGQAPLLFQWRYNGTNIIGETNNALSLLNVQLNQSGQYSVVVSNELGLASSTATLTVVIPTVTETFFTDAFDTTNSAPLWITNRSSTDTRVTFFYNYAAEGIPSAPNSTGNTTRGIKLEANMATTNVAAISLSPVSKSFTGNFDLKFDMWINANGDFPDGGTGSSQFVTATLGTLGNTVQWGSANSMSDGTWFAVDGEGQAVDTALFSDFMAYIGTTQRTTNSGTYSAGTAAIARGNSHPYYSATFPGGQPIPASQTSTYPNQSGTLDVGSVGFKWRDVLVRKTGTKVDWFIDDLRIASVTNAVFNGNNIAIGYWDPFTSVSDNAAMSFGLIDNLRVERTTDAVFPSFTVQPQSKTIVQGTNVLFTTAATGTTNLFFQWKFNGANLAGQTASNLSLTNVQPTAEGTYSVVVSNIAGKVTSSNATLVVVVPPSIITQPEHQNARVGDSIEFNVEATGTAPLLYQWSFNGTAIENATNSSLAFTNLQSIDAGDYAVVITNAAGSALSDSVTLVVNLPVITRFDMLLLDPNGQPQISLRGPAGSSYTIQVSTNLLHWDHLTNVVLDDEEVVEFLDVVPTNSTRFYRAISP